MGLRFRRSVRLFPGVRLNFSRSGLSATVGVRGAGLTLGSRGTYANIGIPGTGLSYRTRVDSPYRQARSNFEGNAGSSAPPLTPNPLPTEAPVPTPGATQIHSSSVSSMTSAGLSEVKRLINEAAGRRADLTRSISEITAILHKRERKLRIAQAFIIRLFTQNIVPRLASEVLESGTELDKAQRELEGCYVPIEFGLDDAANGTFAALSRSFSALSSSQKIWDITETAQTNRVKERTTATKSINRVLVRFYFADVELIRSKYKSLCLRNASSLEIHLYPGFVLTKEVGSDFALVEWKDVSVEQSLSRFIETDPVPSDSEVVGHTWAKANKDGSPDRRFSDNRQIPIAKYGEIWLSSPTGLYEAYMVSSYAKSEDFAAAVLNHKATLARIDSVPASPEDLESAEVPHDPEASTDPAEHLEPKKSYPLDWFALASLILMSVVGGIWIHNNSRQLLLALQAAPRAIQSPIAQVASPRPVLPNLYVVPVAINVRANPTTSSAIVTKLQSGKLVHPFGVQGSWTRIGEDAPFGWTLTKFLSSELKATSVVVAKKQRAEKGSQSMKPQPVQSAIVTSDNSIAPVCTHQQLVEARIARLNGYTGGPKCE